MISFKSDPPHPVERERYLHKALTEGRLKVGEWVRVNPKIMHASRGYPGVVTGYSRDGLVTFANGEFQGHAGAKHLISLTREEGCNLTREMDSNLMEVRKTRILQKHSGRTSEETLENLLEHIAKEEIRWSNRL